MKDSGTKTQKRKTPDMVRHRLSEHHVLKSFLQVQPNLTIDVVTSFYSTAHHHAVISLDVMQLTFILLPIFFSQYI